MQISIDVPSKAKLFKRGCPVSIAPEGGKWSKSQLGDYKSKSGVYVHYVKGKILYVGITIKAGSWGNFGERLRREFQKSASSNSELFRLLALQSSPIHSCFFDLEEIDNMVRSKPEILSKEKKALIMEQILIDIFAPNGNKKDKSRQDA